MKLQQSFIPLFSVISLVCLPSLISSQTCQKTCGEQPLRYPFGSGPGCGDPRFQPYVTCNQQKLTLTTHSGCYPITSIDYSNQVIYISDPSMSTCSCSQPSKGFSLDWNAPFTFHDSDVFALLDCSTTSSPLYKSNSSTAPLCDPEGIPICSLLYSCNAISTLNLPISTCCVYTPVDLGPSFQMDLQKLHCTSYSGFYSHQETNPEKWRYGVALKYKFNVDDNYPSLCASCQTSDGVCGYTGAYNSFVCNCPGAVNTTTVCLFESYWNNASRLLPPQTGTWLIRSMVAWLLVCFFL
ncbi:wall-associated receptor kinase-like 20 [Malania oleifera]|uniref:wall-associated receptor kinase-like 20 n=1 Tax=Malania oleifera TaxID=397392 RepID=UPI0025AE3943|nr:wall-associated receptor kinase-like 20 [Malania oleifera]